MGEGRRVAAGAKVRVSNWVSKEVEADASQNDSHDQADDTWSQGPWGKVRRIDQVSRVDERGSRARDAEAPNDNERHAHRPQARRTRTLGRRPCLEGRRVLEPIDGDLSHVGRRRGGRGHHQHH